MKCESVQKIESYQHHSTRPIKTYNNETNNKLSRTIAK